MLDLPHCPSIVVHALHISLPYHSANTLKAQALSPKAPCQETLMPQVMDLLREAAPPLEALVP